MYVPMTNADRMKFLAFGPCTVRRIHGWNNQGADSYIQLHQKIADVIVTPLTVGDVPISKSILAQANNGFNYIFGDAGIAFDALCLGISSTETSFTDVGSNKGLDMTVELDTEYSPPSTIAVTGDLSSGRDSLTPWTDSIANIADRLLRVDYTNNDGATRYLLISADGGTTVMPNQVYQVASAATLTLEFGREGLYCNTQDAAYAQHYGCKIIQSTTALASGLTASSVSYIKALWR